MITFTTRWNSTCKVICLVKDWKQNPQLKNQLHKNEMQMLLGILNPWIYKIQGSGEKKKTTTCILQMYLLADYYQKCIPTKLNVSSLVNRLTWVVLQEPQSWQHLSKYELYLKLFKPDLPPWEKYALSYYVFNLSCETWL